MVTIIHSAKNNTKAKKHLTLQHGGPSMYQVSIESDMSSVRKKGESVRYVKCPGKSGKCPLWKVAKKKVESGGGNRPSPSSAKLSYFFNFNTSDSEVLSQKF